LRRRDWPLLAGKRPTPADRSDRASRTAGVEIFLQWLGGSNPAGDAAQFFAQMVAVGLHRLGAGRRLSILTSHSRGLLARLRTASATTLFNC